MAHSNLPGWASFLNGVSGAALRARPGGRVPVHLAIDGHKAATGPVVAALMIMYGTYTTPAWIYLALHGSYGVAWVIKDVVFPDRRWRRRVTMASALVALLFLSLYWVAPVLLITGAPGPEWSPAPAWGLALAVAVHTLGLVLMIGADAQKYLTLRQERERLEREALAGPGLITTGFYRHVRHPNYLGEMLVYGSYALIVNHWLPWVILAGVWGLLFLPSMLAIEASLSRYPEYAAWRARTGFLLPRVG